MPGYDALNTQTAPSKSVFDSQQLSRPAAYRHCGRASLIIGIVCILAEVSVFVLKRGLTTLGVGIWTGATFVMFGAASMAVPKTRSVCSVNTCFAMALCSMAICVLGVLACIVHILMLHSILQYNYTPRPNFELTCEICGLAIIMKEVGQVVLLLAQFLVSMALLYFAYTDCLCCRATETEVIMQGGSGPAKPAAAPAVPDSIAVNMQAMQGSTNHQSSQGGNVFSQLASARIGGASASGPMLYEL
ncbi:hypothetical protein BOX15_Mlig024904g2 [Macrostomum lignano]|uniref:MARVEL domain-containing protein n=1 Tax=Macrostomum lignano TaxID=282301 RepID=A0A267EYG1_9PLAT|nr:hypothetical protein BOX15_Mlig024904g3 [Macrostomum lignano]PAA66516.1 hypothetical protein BOX15_Mlig024904g1 [Macrostomum lignano]PAA84862.1 hypothetical protein BOX15_Mlig024904g2 [Macrostomum lignano]